MMCWLHRFGQTTSGHIYTHRVLLSKDKDKGKKNGYTQGSRYSSLETSVTPPLPIKRSYKKTVQECDVRLAKDKNFWKSQDRKANKVGVILFWFFACFLIVSGRRKS